MTSQEASSFSSMNGPYTSSRAHIALTQLDADLNHPDRAPAILEALQRPEADNKFDFINDFLIPSDQAGWDGMLNNKFCKEMVKTKKDDERMLGHFKWYMLQDMTYLKNMVYWKLGFYSSAPWDDVSSAPDSIASTIKFVNYMIKDTLMDKLGIPEQTIKTVVTTPTLKQYNDYLIDSSRRDDWFSVHVAMVPGVVGYEAIFNALYDDPNIDKESAFYKLWVVPNHGHSGTKAYKEFLNKYYQQYKSPELEAHWKDLFKKSCAFETDFFDASLTHTL